MSENDGQYSVEDDPNDQNSQWQDVQPHHSHQYHHKACKNAQACASNQPAD
ncbi:MAG: hypothetical protein ACK521_09625 [bacterium]